MFVSGKMQSPRADVMPERREGFSRAERLIENLRYLFMIFIGMSSKNFQKLV